MGSIVEAIYDSLEDDSNGIVRKIETGDIVPTEAGGQIAMVYTENAQTMRYHALAIKDIEQMDDARDAERRTQRHSPRGDPREKNNSQKREGEPDPDIETRGKKYKSDNAGDGPTEKQFEDLTKLLEKSHAQMERIEKALAAMKEDMNQYRKDIEDVRTDACETRRVMLCKFEELKSQVLEAVGAAIIEREKQQGGQQEEEAKWDERPVMIQAAKMIVEERKLSLMREGRSEEASTLNPLIKALAKSQSCEQDMTEAIDETTPDVESFDGSMTKLLENIQDSYMHTRIHYEKSGEEDASTKANQICLQIGAAKERAWQIAPELQGGYNVQEFRTRAEQITTKWGDEEDENEQAEEEAEQEYPPGWPPGMPPGMGYQPLLPPNQYAMQPPGSPMGHGNQFAHSGPPYLVPAAMSPDMHQWPYHINAPGQIMQQHQQQVYPMPMEPPVKSSTGQTRTTTANRERETVVKQDQAEGRTYIPKPARMETKIFNAWVKQLKDIGCKFDNDKKRWYLPQEQKITAQEMKVMKEYGVNDEEIEKHKGGRAENRAESTGQTMENKEGEKEYEKNSEPQPGELFQKTCFGCGGPCELKAAPGGYTVYRCKSQKTFRCKAQAGQGKVKFYSVPSSCQVEPGVYQCDWESLTGKKGWKGSGVRGHMTREEAENAMEA